MENPQNQEIQPANKPANQSAPKRAIPTFIGIAIIAVVSVVLFGGVFAYQYFFVKPQPVVQTQINQAVFDWEGIYEFTEVAPGLPNSEQPNMVEDYVLSISSVDGRWHLGLNVDGFQSLIRIVATANNVGKSLDVIFDSYGPEDSFGGNFKKGDVLFTLTPTSEGLAIQWKKMQPNFNNTGASNSFFVKMRTDTQTQANQTVGWKTYKNDEYGFQIDYPSNLNSDVDKANGYSVTFHSGTIYQDNLTGRFLISLTLPDAFRGFNNCNLSSLFGEQIGYNCEKNCTCTDCGAPPLCDKIEKIGGNKAIRFEEIGGGFHYLLENKNNYFEISYFVGNSLSQENINQMLSTFKFTK